MKVNIPTRELAKGKNAIAHTGLLINAKSHRSCFERGVEKKGGKKTTERQKEREKEQEKERNRTKRNY